MLIGFLFSPNVFWNSQILYMFSHWALQAQTATHPQCTFSKVIMKNLFLFFFYGKTRHRDQGQKDSYQYWYDESSVNQYINVDGSLTKHRLSKE